ncbi:MAG: GDP-L-fucose synthase [Alphaproteobacteria bacterium MarineAlpha11_Bin1]|nr:MAG: GDP-L-fucose synthase [Alphaproteobacteria bacterium MarineAlpha11_Bin1]
MTGKLIGQLPVICVTGASGYLGGRVLAGLQRVGIAATACPGRRDGLDLTDSEATINYFVRGKFDAVIHCAAYVPKVAKDYLDDGAGAASLSMTENIIAANVPHIVFTSSMTVYPSGSPMPVREDSPDTGVTGYGGYKRRAERALCAAEHLKATILRLPGLFGAPRQGGLLHNAAMRFAQGQVPTLTTPFPMWAAIHVDDAADLLCRAAGTPPARSLILNAGYPDPMSVTRTVSQLAAIFGIEIPEDDAPLFQMDLSALTKELGLPAHSLGERLRELAVSAQESEETVCA